MRTAGDADVVGHGVAHRREALAVVVPGAGREDQLARVEDRFEDADTLVTELGDPAVPRNSKTWSVWSLR